MCENEVTDVFDLAPNKSPASLDDLFQVIEEAEVPEEFMAERDNGQGEFRVIFSGIIHRSCG